MVFSPMSRAWILGQIASPKHGLHAYIWQSLGELHGRYSPVTPNKRWSLDRVLDRLASLSFNLRSDEERNSLECLAGNLACLLTRQGTQAVARLSSRRARASEVGSPSLLSQSAGSSNWHLSPSGAKTRSTIPPNS